ncbi:patatin-like phospholipase family protein [Porphyromonas gingivalis]|uniref:CBASS cGAMP-activated phospholipase n=1 Tax=Porphyromonas gingivalis TaxID=837 RepID=UPI001F307D60|nr:CBASS cGAMP-activated phospholipase [Porphyromonas gingivalis]MCE8189705.1 patatin-like phospholipase family protein [Porphyromonas gingivalis]
MKKPFKILCIDGGGIKGLFSAQVLAKFEEVFNTNISDQFDLICGTSTGGIIALAASAKIPMSDVVSFYKDKGPLIFAEHKKGFLGEICLKAKQILYKGKYSNKELKRALTEVFGSRKISESSNLLCITAFNITTATPRVFKKDYNRFTEDNKRTYVDVALATSAAPTYLPIHDLEADQFVDGGVWANNPSLVGLMEFLYQFSEDERFDGVDILSISSLEVPQGRAPMPSNSSFLNWQSKLIDLFSIGQAKNIEKLFEYLDGKFKFPIHYTRVSNAPPSHEQMKIIDMDNASEDALKLLQSIGEATANQAKMKDVIRNAFSTGKTILN